MAEGPPRLGPLERQVMEVLWDSPEKLSTREVRERIGQSLAYTTVATVLNNLARKELVEKVPLARAWGYRPALSRSQYSASLMSEALSTGGDRRDALLHFVGSMSEADTALLRSLLAEDPPGS